MTERRYRIAVIPGDGIGPEVTREALRVLEAVALSHPFKLDISSYDLGAERYLSTGEVLEDSDLEELRAHHAILLGAVGDPRVEPGVLERGLLIRLRRELDLYVNLRPARHLQGVPAPAGDLDVVIVRENTEGLYSGVGEVSGAGSNKERATEVSVNTASGVERIVRYAFETAEKLKASLSLVHKTNVLPRAGGLYTRIFEKVSEEHSEVRTDYYHVDAAALLMTTDPARFQVIVTDNLFGDILSDLAAGLAGGIGFVGSANLNPGGTSMFEPVHGSAPDIAGAGKANPLGAILSAALMLRHLGEEKPAEAVEAAVARSAGRIATEFPGTPKATDLVLEGLQ